MIKLCVVLDGKIIHIGKWDYQYTEIEGKQVAQNPMPEGANIEEREFEYSEEYGWREAGFVAPPKIEDRLAEKDEQILELKKEIFVISKVLSENDKAQQNLLELLIDTGVL